MNPNVPIIRYDGTHKKGADGKEIRLSVPTPTPGSCCAAPSKAQINIWCWPIGSGEVYGYRMDEKMPAAVRAGVTPPKNADHNVGEWNTFEITVRGNRLTVVLNGQTVIKLSGIAGPPRERPGRSSAPRLEKRRRLDQSAGAGAVPEYFYRRAALSQLDHRIVTLDIRTGNIRLSRYVHSYHHPRRAEQGSEHDSRRGNTVADARRRAGC